ncbi:hypothetical protein BJ741DRAFT_620449 [Chytriomyces cf. hyalinus JEL632]|nr:hypothetical protein BJ741DRAFT_620449 [Chytriomyces cf. hyalinus JEL632]
MVSKRYRKVFLDRRSIICQHHVERKIMASFSPKSHEQQQLDLQQLSQRHGGQRDTFKDQIITMNQNSVRPRLEDAYTIFMDFCRQWWWARLQSHQLYRRAKEQPRLENYRTAILDGPPESDDESETTTTTSSGVGEYYISVDTLLYIFRLYNRAVYHEEVQTRNEIIFSIAFGPGLGSTDGIHEGRDEDEVLDDEPDDDDNECVIMQWLQANFGKEFPRQEIIFLNPTNDTLEYRRRCIIDPHKRARVNASGNDWGGAASSSKTAKKPRFDSYEQISLRSAIAEVLHTTTDPCMALSACSGRALADHEETVMWNRCTNQVDFV